jgi:hypothetical protein
VSSSFTVENTLKHVKVRLTIPIKRRSSVIDLGVHIIIFDSSCLVGVDPYSVLIQHIDSSLARNAFLLIKHHTSASEMLLVVFLLQRL